MDRSGRAGRVAGGGRRPHSPRSRSPSRGASAPRATRERHGPPTVHRTDPRRQHRGEHRPVPRHQRLTPPGITEPLHHSQGLDPLPAVEPQVGLVRADQDTAELCGRRAARGARSRPRRWARRSRLPDVHRTAALAVERPDAAQARPGGQGAQGPAARLPPHGGHGCRQLDLGRERVRSARPRQRGDDASGLREAESPGSGRARRDRLVTQASADLLAERKKQ